MRARARFYGSLVRLSTAGILAAAAIVSISQGSALASTSSTPELMPAGGQFFPITPVSVLDTRDGTGGVSIAPLPANSTVTIPVMGVGAIPADSVSDVYAVITAFGPSQSGALEVYNADNSNPGIWAVPETPGQNTSVGDMIQLGAAGYVSVTNNSSGTANVAITVRGYVQTSDTTTSGDTYVGLPYGGILDTRSGYGEPQGPGQIPAGGSVTVQVTGMAGVPSDAAGAAVYLGAANATQSGWISAYPAGTTDPGLRVLSYSPGRTVRNLYIGALSTPGQLTLTNHGSAPVDLMGAVQGYLVNPSGASEAGSTYTSVTPQRIADTRDGTGGVAATPVPAGGSITFSTAGVDGIPSSGVSAVAESIAASNPATTGSLSAYPAGGTDPNNVVLNFNGGDSQDNDLIAPLVSAVSPAGQETITNHSNGTVDVVVTALGYYSAPAAPDTPMQVDGAMQNGTATISWAPPLTDGGAAITSYAVTIYNSDGSVNQTITGQAQGTSAAASGLNDSSTYTVGVSAVNAVGASAQDIEPVNEIQTGSDVAQTQTLSEDLELNVDPSTGDLSYSSSSGAVDTFDTNGNMTSSTAFTPPDPFTAPFPNLGTFACVINTQKGVSPVAHKPFYEDKNGTTATEEWFNEAYSVKNARYVQGEGETFQEMLCSTGGGESKGSWHMWFVGDAVYLKATSPHKDGQKGGTNKSYNSSGGVQSVTFGYTLPVGKAGSINGSVDFDLNKGTEGYDVGNDGKFRSFPSGDLKYWKNRANVFWITAAHHVWDGTTSYKGNTMETLYEWPMSNKTGFKLDAHVDLGYLCGSVFGC